MRAELVLSRLEGVRAGGLGQWMTLCPAHGDRSPSLSVRELPDERVLVHCFAGCGADEVLQAIGLDFAALYPDGPLGDRLPPERRVLPAASAFPAAAGGTPLATKLTPAVANRGAMSYQDDRDRRQAAAGRPTRVPIKPSERAAMQQAQRADREAAEAEQRARWAVQAPRLAAMWEAALPVMPGDLVFQYLEHRALGLAPIPAEIRYAPAIDYYEPDERTGKSRWRGRYAAMTARVLAPTDVLRTLHVTLLTPDGRKAPVAKPKKLMPAAGPVAESAIRLAAVGADGVLGVAEGIETAIAAMLGSGVPTWATVSASGMAAFVWPPGVRHLVIFADHDANGVGQRAAERLRLRALNAGLSVEVRLPSQPGTDWADVWAAEQQLVEAAA